MPPPRNDPFLLAHDITKALVNTSIKPALDKQSNSRACEDLAAEKLSGNFWRLSQSLASTTTSGPPLLLLAADDLDRGGWRRTVLTGKGPRVM
ncbi:hypothetical protein TNCT_649711 [Trichonephila clavata]|uniref:Uncharacterized protein n=1 Tax=Trichonephila clavata TaxID=2740835 RepID=A0A8X6FSX3_TRICU|nr:hypothetical protein TNCT_649711 [Trichonephila clavata]